MLTRSTSIRQFVRDRDGAIAMTGLVMAPVLTAACWYQLMASRQILQREQGQIAADAIAAGGAQWLAAGMNILAMMNVIMAAVLAFFVAIRAAEILCVAAAIVFFGLGLIPGFEWAESLAEQAGEFGEKAFDLEEKVAPKIMKGLNIATKAERIVARAFPYISVAVSTTMAKIKEDQSGFGVAGNLGLVPTGIDKTASTLSGGLEFPERMGTLQDSEEDENKTLQEKLKGLAQVGNLVGSLPVEGEGYPQICSRAAGDWATVPFIQKIPFLDKLGTVLSFIGGNFTALLCQPISQAKAQIADQVSSVTQQAVDAKATSVVTPGCEADLAAGKLSKGQKRSQRSDAQNLKNCIKGRVGNWKGSKEGKDFRSTFEKDEKAKLDKLQKDVSTEGIETAKLWSLITDGGATLADGDEITALDPNMFMNAFSIYRAPDGRGGDTGRDFGAIGALTGGATDEASAPTPGFQKDWSSAQARMYFDCGSKDVFGRSSADHGIHGCADNSMWRPGAWKWVMVVDHSISEEGKATGEQVVSGYVSWFTGEVAQKALGAVLKIGAKKFAPTPGATGTGPLAVWTQRIRGTINADGGGRAGLGNAHALDWWVGNTAGNAVDNAIHHDKFELQPYFH